MNGASKWRKRDGPFDPHGDILFLIERLARTSGRIALPSVFFHRFHEDRIVPPFPVVLVIYSSKFINPQRVSLFSKSKHQSKALFPSFKMSIGLIVGELQRSRGGNGYVQKTTLYSLAFLREIRFKSGKPPWELRITRSSLQDLAF